MNSNSTCPCCSARAELYLVSSDCNRKLSEESFSYYRCSKCGLVFIDPVPSDLDRFYAGGYQPIPESVEVLRALAAKERYRLKPVLEKAGGDLLEIGPWIGVFSINAKDAGFNVDVIEMNTDAARFLKEKVGIKVANTNDPVKELQIEKRYDVIALWHSLEHLPKPWEVLKAASKRLKPGGMLLIAIPNIASKQAKLLGAQWWHLDAPRHLYFWSPEDLARLVQSFGLITTKLDTDDRLSDILSRSAWKHYLHTKLGMSLFGRAVAKALAPIGDLVTQNSGVGSGLTATFRAPLNASSNAMRPCEDL